MNRSMEDILESGTHLEVLSILHDCAEMKNLWQRREYKAKKALDKRFPDKKGFNYGPHG